MVILSKAIIKPYKHLLKLTKSKRAKEIDSEKSNNSFIMPLEAQYWDNITETHYGCDDVVNGSRLLQLIYSQVAQMMNNAEESINNNYDVIVKADKLLTASLAVKPYYMFDKKDFFEHKGLTVEPLDRRALIKLLKQKIDELHKHTELEL